MLWFASAAPFVWISPPPALVLGLACTASTDRHDHPWLLPMPTGSSTLAMHMCAVFRVHRNQRADRHTIHHAQHTPRE
jgi:hypothetical protein